MPKLGGQPFGIIQLEVKPTSKITLSSNVHSNVKQPDTWATWAFFLSGVSLLPLRHIAVLQASATEPSSPSLKFFFSILAIYN